MKVFNELNINKGLSLAFGFFDGMHLGHRAVVKRAVDFAKENDVKSAVITFQDHPCCYFYDVQPKYIIKRQDKIKMLESLGVDCVYFLKFDDYLAMMTASEYLEDVIIKHFAPSAISTGFNHFFGAGKTGNVDLLCTMQKDFCYQYFEVSPVLVDEQIVNSTAIREFISQGNVEMVNKMLGYNYFLEETVVEGEKLGRQLGFKTANLYYPDNLVEIGKGVYKVNIEYCGNVYSGIANYGVRPTVTEPRNVTLNSIQGRIDEQTLDSPVKPVLEVHILDFDKDIYGEKIKVNFLNKIRDEKRFNSLDELKAQIQKDIEA